MEAAGNSDYRWLYWLENGFGGVQFDRDNTENQVVRSLIRIRETNFPYEIYFKVRGITWTETIAHEMILTFEHYVNSGRQWDEAVFDELFYDQDMSPHLQFVFEAPVTSQLFRKVTYRNRLSRFNGQIEKQLAIACSFILRNGRHLEMVEVRDVNLSERCHVSLVASFASPRPRLHHSLVSREGGTSSKYKKKSGAVLCFDFLTPNLTDSEAFLLIRSLISHRSLKKLRLSHLEFGGATTGAICCLLATQNCQLLDLFLSAHHIEHPEDIPVESLQFDFERFYDWLPVNTSVQTLKFGKLDSIDNDSTNQFLQRLWKFPNLRLLCVDNSNIGFTDFVRLASNVTMSTPPSRLRVLDIGWKGTSGVPTCDGHLAVRAILHLLDVFPELCDFGNRFTDAIRDRVLPTSLIERLDLNRCCGMLLRGAPTVAPLSIWPVVLAKATRNRHISQSRRANVIYRILQGPVFVERNPLDHELFK